MPNAAVKKGCRLIAHLPHALIDGWHQLPASTMDALSNAGEHLPPAQARFGYSGLGEFLGQITSTVAPAGATPAVPDWLSYFFQFKSYAALFVAAIIGTAILTPLYILLAGRLGWVDLPGGRKRHDRATATMGGLVIFAVVFTGALVSLELENLVGEMLRARAAYVYGLMICTTAMILLGIVDDRHGVSPKVKLLVQCVVALAAVLLGFRVDAITLPGYDTLTLPPVIGALISLVWIVGITNAINLTDGLDGLAAGVCLLASGVNAIVAIWLGNHYMTVMMVLLAGSLLGFLRWNFHPARVFLGDTGSLGLGMFLALASLHSAQKAHTVVLILVPMFALGYPIFDTLLAVARRMFRGQPLFASDRDHIHHRLLDRGQTPSRAAIQIYAASILVSLVCLAAMTANHFVLGLIVVGVLVMALFAARVLGYLEWGGWNAHWTGRQETKILHAAAHLARLKIESAESPDELLRAVAILAVELDCHRIELTREGQTYTWADVGAAASQAPDAGTAVELADGVALRMRAWISRAQPLDAEKSQLLEELGDLVLSRMKPAATV